ncbi:hypothetical protein [Streptococcus ruminantium]|uniref:hypothetical protein n=1 Tax=Streptococcus ruminantium TaxID=1917441 RepID=UPI0012DD17B2|nr:hypothetical protein [Streptococcus ruminantium]
MENDSAQFILLARNLSSYKSKLGDYEASGARLLAFFSNNIDRSNEPLQDKIVKYHPR